MEAGWVQDSFEKNDMKIDRSFSTFIDHVHEKIIPENDCIEVQLDLYKKDIDAKESLYRMIIALADDSKKTVQVADATVKAVGFDFTFVSSEFATLKPVTVESNKAAASAQKYGNDATLSVFEFKTPIKEKFFLVKAGGKSKICKLNATQNGLEEYREFNY